MFFAGHETTASILAATFCFLAADQGEQDVVYEEIQSVTKETTELTFTQYESLVKTRSAFAEALRMYPAASLLLRETREATVLQVPAGIDAHGNVIEESVPVPKGVVIGVDMVGMRTSSVLPR
jgi:cytochrome P450